MQAQAPGVSITQSSVCRVRALRLTSGYRYCGRFWLRIRNRRCGRRRYQTRSTHRIIESIDVLKDAASAAIYGARAANGVILVLPNAPKKVSSTYLDAGWVQNVYKMPSLLNAKEYIRYWTKQDLMGTPLIDLQRNSKSYQQKWMAHERHQRLRARNKNALTQNHAISCWAVASV